MIGAATLTKRERSELRQKTEIFSKFARGFIGVQLRRYQVEAGEAIIRDVFERKGNTFVIIFSRQSGKDELLANIFLFLMARLCEIGGSIVCTQPTFKPQTINAMDRLRSRSMQRPFFAGLRRSDGYIFRFLAARVLYFSADPAANVVGATADRLLVINEAQDVDPALYDKRFAPMAAAGNATRVFSGTSWTSQTLLARELRLARDAEKRDGIKRVFLVDGPQVARLNPHYGRFLKTEIEKLGRNHPLVRTQYFCEEIDAQAGMFNETRRALMTGDQPAQDTPIPGHSYAFLIDVAGQDEALLNLDGMGNPGRDSTTLTIVDVDLSTLATLQAPTYRAVKRMTWTGISHLKIFGQIKALADTWKPQNLLIDATGVGEGLWAMLDKAYPLRVTPIKFSQQMKSEIGWGFLAIIETGRFRDCAPSDEIRIQYANCQSEILPGPSKTLRWGVPDGSRGPNGELIHDDFILADALTATLDKFEWQSHSPALIVQGIDPLESMDRNF
jgi:hypothetical protein